MNAVYQWKIREGRENVKRMKGNIINSENIKGIDGIRE
jgi:hypothetical protein